jgi:hypothetical protein
MDWRRAFTALLSRQTLGDITSLRRRYGLTETAEHVGEEKKIGCFIVYDHYHERLGAEDNLSGLLQSGSIQSFTNVTYGFERVPDAVLELFTKPHAGHAQVDFRQRRTERQSCVVRSHHLLTSPATQPTRRGRR